MFTLNFGIGKLRTYPVETWLAVGVAALNILDQLSNELRLEQHRLVNTTMPQD